MSNIDKSNGPNSHLSNGGGAVERKTYTRKAKKPQHSAPASAGIAQGAVERLSAERQGSSQLAVQLDQGVQQMAEADAAALADLTRSLMSRTLQAYTRQLQEDPGEGAEIASMFLEGIAAIPAASASLTVESVAESLPAASEARASKSLPPSPKQ